MVNILPTQIMNRAGRSYCQMNFSPRNLIARRVLTITAIEHAFDSKIKSAKGNDSIMNIEAN